MISDRDRGWAWANALMGAPAKKVILTGSSNALPAVKELCTYLGEELEIVEFTRKNELAMLPSPTSMRNIEPQTAVVAFSRRDVLSLKQQLSEKYRVSVVYGNLSLKLDEKRPDVLERESLRYLFPPMPLLWD